MVVARYDRVADFYEAGWSGPLDDPASTALLDLTGVVTGRRVLDIACGHGRLSRALASEGAAVTGVDIAGQLIGRAVAADQEDPLGIRYVKADVSSPNWWDGTMFDIAVCSFGLSDIDDLDGCLAVVANALESGGRFVFSILHPCFPGDQDASGSWPSDGGYHDQRWWAADGTGSTLRRQVGANHRTVSTYFNALGRHGFTLDVMAEPQPPAEWVRQQRPAARFPVFLVARFVKR